MFRFVWAVQGDAEVVGLFLGESGELHADFIEVQAGHFFIEFLGQAIDARLVDVAIFPEVELSQGLIGEGVRHHETRMAVSATEIYEATFGQKENAVPI